MIIVIIHHLNIIINVFVIVIVVIVISIVVLRSALKRGWTVWRAGKRKTKSEYCLVFHPNDPLIISSLKFFVPIFYSHIVTTAYFLHSLSVVCQNPCLPLLGKFSSEFFQFRLFRRILSSLMSSEENERVCS